MPLQPVSMKKMTGMDETVDELMIIVAKETNYPLGDLEKMEVIRFLRVVENVKKMVKARSEGEAETSNEQKETVRSRRR